MPKSEPDREFYECPYECGEVFATRELLNEHLDDYCPKELEPNG